MHFVDYLTLMIVNMAAALFVFALWMFFFEKEPKKVVPGFLLTGGIALVTGFAMSLTWPLPGINNIMMGEPTVLLGAVFFMAGLCIALDWDLITIGVIAFGSGAVAILLGIHILVLGLGSSPIIGGLGYIFAGAAAVLSLPVIGLPKMKWLRWVAGAVALVAAALWVITGFGAYWNHIIAAGFKSWVPSQPIPPAAAPAAQ